MTTTALSVTTLDGGRVELAERDLDVLRRAVGGHVLLPGDAAWAEATQIWNAMAASTPAVVVQPRSAHEAAEVVRFAARRGALLSVKGGGHNIAGTALAEGAVTMDLSRLREVVVDAEQRLVHVGAGCRLADVDRATQEHGLATPLGFVSRVGVAGLALGGGLGYLSRRFGWTADNLVSAEVVTADGEVRVASRQDHPDLFWGLRGAGANLGVVTRFSFRLHEVGPTVVGGLLAWPATHAEELLATYRDVTASAPRELSVFLELLQAPPAPFVPPELHGERICAMAVCFSGDRHDADDVLAPLRQVRRPAVDLVRAQPYVEVQSYLDDTQPSGMHHYWKTEYLTGLDDGLLDVVRELAAQCPVPHAQIGFLHLGGAIADRRDDDGAVGNRHVRYAIGVNGMWEPQHPHEQAYRRWVRGAWQRVLPYSCGTSYINFQGSDEDAERVRSAYGDRYSRLARVKAAYDPTNVLRVNRNVPPAVPARTG